MYRGDGCGKVWLGEHLAEVNLDAGCDGGEREVVDGVVEWVFEIATDPVEREEHKADDGGAEGCEPAEVFDQAEGKKKAVDLDEEHGEVVVLLGHGGVFDALGTALRVGESADGSVDRMPFERLDPARGTGFVEQDADPHL